MIKIYNLIIFILTPFLYFYFNHRKKIGKENIEKFPQKKGIYTVKRPKEQLIWFHAVSVGETLSVIPLINKLYEQYNGKLNILLTTSTVTSEKIIKGRINKNILHQFAPIDKKQYVQKFLSHFNPDIGIWVESELWPNLINESAKKKFPMILLNARISDKKPLKRFLYQLFAKNLINKFNLVIPQEQKDHLRIKELGIKNTQYIGNLKLNAPPLPYNKTSYNSLQKQTKTRKLFLAVSTHPGEENLISDVHHELRLSHPELLTIIVPRHPERSEEIEYLLKEAKMLSVTVRSRNEKITDKTDIYLADTLGELGLFYYLCNISFIGGSLVNIGGHNPIEAANSNTAIISGNYIHNFTDIYDNLVKNNSALIVNNIYDLETHINEFLINPKSTDKYIKNARSYIKQQSDIIDKTILAITKYLKL